MKKRTKQTLTSETTMILEEAALSYDTTYAKNKLHALPQNHLKKTISLLGLDSDPSFKKISNNSDFIQNIRIGLPLKSLHAILKITGFSLTEGAFFLNTTDRTLRRYDIKHRLNAEQSERLIEIAKLYARGFEIFGSQEIFNKWMATEIISLGNKKPSSFLDTSIGINLLMDELGRIEHGILA